MIAAERQLALSAGAGSYFTGKPCKHGHVARRWTKSGCCVVCAALARKSTERGRASSRSWKARNKDRARASQDAWSKNNVEARRASIRRSRAKWAKDPANKTKVNAWAAERRAALSQRTPRWVDREALAAIYAGCPNGFHVDHAVPLHGETVSGLHVPWNLQYLPAQENLRKSNSWR